MDVKRRELMAERAEQAEQEDIVSERPLTPDLFNALFSRK